MSAPGIFNDTLGPVMRGRSSSHTAGSFHIAVLARAMLGAASAFVCADLVMGGCENSIGLDETVDAVYDVGRMMPAELRCTARGGLAITPSALKLQRRPPARQ